MNLRTYLVLPALLLLLVSCASQETMAADGFQTYLVRLKPGVSGPRINLNDLLGSGSGDMPVRTFRIDASHERISFIKSLRRARTGLNRLATQLDGLKSRHRGYKKLWLVGGMRVTCTEDLARQIQDRDDVAEVIADPFLAIDVPAPKKRRTVLSAGSWQLRTTQVDQVRSQDGLTGRGVRVGIIDSGIVNEGPLKGRIAAYRDFTSNPSQLPTDPHGHGTAVASILAGAPETDGSGAAPGCQLVVARVLEEMRLPGSETNRRKVVGAFASRIVEAMQWMLDPDENPETDDAPRVVNNSWGFSDTSLLPPDYFKPATAAWSRAGILAVFSSGNTNSRTSKHTFFPASYPSVLAVGSVGIDKSISSFSAVGRPGSSLQKPDLVAPGQSVIGWKMWTGYQALDGTSFASPQVAATAALLLEAWPDLERRDLIELLTESAADLGTLGADRVYGHGLLQSRSAVNRLAARLEESLAGSSDIQGFLAGLEPLLSRQELPFAEKLASRVTAQFAQGLSHAQVDEVARVRGSPAKSYLLAHLRDRATGIQMASR